MEAYASVLTEKYKGAPRNEPFSDVCESNDNRDANNANKEQSYVTRNGKKVVRPDRLKL